MSEGTFTIRDAALLCLWLLAVVGFVVIVRRIFGFAAHFAMVLRQRETREMFREKQADAPATWPGSSTPAPFQANMVEEIRPDERPAAVSMAALIDEIESDDPGRAAKARRALREMGYTKVNGVYLASAEEGCP